ncbi:hypothetical protein GX51_00619 [Blastomyces parvus]|uniref:Uncharacterized protein n=1 Tax=Blastomyces parvus TaxID=2060905 RepID=A0A2B7XCX6_9EURO|nr:hypothetical protein GX51_00619 [Blastomyces parvus]
MQLLGSNWTTNDVDILVSGRENISSLASMLADQDGFSNIGISVHSANQYGYGGSTITHGLGPTTSCPSIPRKRT